MREIKFRAMATPDEAGKIDKVWYSTDDVGHGAFWGMVEAGTLVRVCQYTGLKDIYEGDIIDSETYIDDEGLIHRFQVVWKDYGFSLSNVAGEASYFTLDDLKEIKVIGNIYQT